jgi:hypothetical protein
VTNRNTSSASVRINGADLVAENRQRLLVAEQALTAESAVRIAGRGTQLSMTLREQEFRRVALEFAIPTASAPRPQRLQLDIDGESPVWFGPLMPQRAP